MGTLAEFVDRVRQELADRGLNQYVELDGRRVGAGREVSLDGYNRAPVPARVEIRGFPGASHRREGVAFSRTLSATVRRSVRRDPRQGRREDFERLTLLEFGALSSGAGESLDPTHDIDQLLHPRGRVITGRVAVVDAEKSIACGMDHEDHCLLHQLALLNVSAAGVEGGSEVSLEFLTALVVARRACPPSVPGGSGPRPPG